METKAKKKVLRMLIVNGPPELDFLYSFSRQVFIGLTFQGQGEESEARRILSVCIFGLLVLNRGTDWETWKINGDFRANGIRDWVSHPDEKSGINLWGSFSGEYNKKTRQGWIETINHITTRELAQQIKLKEEQKNEANRKIWKRVGELVQEHLEGIKLMEYFVYTEKGLVEIWREIYCELEEEVRQVKLRRDLHSNHDEFRRLQDFVIFSLRTGFEDLHRANPDKIIEQKVATINGEEKS